VLRDFGAGGNLDPERDVAMSPPDPDFDHPDDPLDDYEYPEEPDDEQPETIRCPACGAEVYEDAVQCPACGDYVTAASGVWSGRPTWWIVLGLVGILAAVLALAGMIPW